MGKHLVASILLAEKAKDLTEFAPRNIYKK